MPPKRATWTEDETKLLLDLCLQEKEKCNFTQQGLTTGGWHNSYTYFPQFDKRQCNNKLGYLKKAYQTWKDGLTATGLGRNPRTGAIDADTEYWETQEGWYIRDWLQSSSVIDKLEAFWGMDNSDEESQNSSKMSFNEVVTAAMAAGIAIADML
ncbi:uncharacterized protein [Miscanthus floridulus]|uniref:uncharacterized protein n=1 Tax=Miscanthus floridulus TaxID=154761 RepID=UPI003457D1EB